MSIIFPLNKISWAKNRGFPLNTVSWGKKSCFLPRVFFLPSPHFFVARKSVSLFFPWCVCLSPHLAQSAIFAFDSLFFPAV